MWWIMQKFPSSKSGLVMGWMFAANIAPIAILGPFAGVLVDRFSRKFIVVVADAMRGFLILWMAYLGFRGQLTISWIYIISVFMGIGDVFFNPSLQSTLPNIVPDKDLTRANGLYKSGMQFTNILGPAIGGVLVGALGVYFVFALNGFSFLFSAITELFIQFRQKFRTSKESPSFIYDLKEGLRFVYFQKIFREFNS